ncbi:MAG: hypothetical protein NZ516_12045 [Raineya sp.]|nr:hypothetical protein [Raineya sp.]
MLTIILLSNWSCGRQKWIETRNRRVSVTMEISNPNKIIHLGDSIVCKVELPDSILVEDLNNQTFYKDFIHFIKPNPARHSLSCMVNMIDTLTKRGTSRQDENKIDYRIILGERVHLPQFTGGALNFSSNRPYKIEFVIKPTLKGIYFLELSPQPGIIEYNTDKQVSLVVRYNAQDSHLDLLAKIYTPNNLNEYYVSHSNYYSLSGGKYAFKVE